MKIVLTVLASLVLGTLLALWMPGARGGEAEDRARIERVTRPTTDFTKPEKYEARPGGAATVFGPFNHNAFSDPSANMSFGRRSDFAVGNGVFRKVWVSAPSSTTSSDGLGPLFNTRSCQRCHLKDGRGRPPEAGKADPALTMAFGISVPGESGAAPDPVYGEQIQTLAIQGHRAEAQVYLEYEPHPLTFADGTVVILQRPKWRLTGLGFGPAHPRTLISPRIAPQMIGMGLLEAIDERDIV
ncbi:MAG TPA: di-heme oxidoredictase family protein, partial [Alphaproteobacteria bacterium]|nr:di-heme oxidoredictase family protein [Alphaproteobacteria bacterium]